MNKINIEKVIDYSNMLKDNEIFNERLVDLALNIHHFNQDVMELNIKYNKEIERLNNIIKEVREEVRIYEVQSKDGITNELDNYVFVQRLKKCIK